MAGEEQNKGDEPKYMTAEEVTQMVTGATERMKKTLTEGFEKSFASFGEKLPELMKPHVEALTKEIPRPDDKPSEKDKPDPKVTALEQKLNEALGTIKAEREAREAAEKKSRDDSAKGSLRSELAKHVRPEALDAVTQLLFDAQRKVAVGEDGSPLFTVRAAPMPGLGEEDMQLPLQDGVAKWLKTDEAKLFIPAPGAQQTAVRGSPMRSSVPVEVPTYDKPATTDEERVRRADERARALAVKYPNLGNDTF